MPATIAILLVLAAGQDGRRDFEEASQALAGGDYAKAEAGFRRVLQAQPGHVGALGNLGVVYSRMERFGEATTVYQRALKLAPADAGLLVNLALVLFRQDRYAEAKPHLAKLVGMAPRHRQARELMATARLYTGEEAAALAELARLESEDSTPGVLFLLAMAHLKMGDRIGFGQTFERLEASLPPDQAAWMRGKAFYESGMFEEAARELERAAERSLDCRRELGKVYVSQRRGEEAARQFRAVLAERPDDRESAYFLGALLVEGGDVEEGRALLERSGSGSWAARYYLGKAALKQGKAAEAVRYLKASADLRPDDATVLYQLLRAHEAAGDRPEADAITARLRGVREKRRAEEQALVVR